jgi:hypothetical protein
MQVGHPNDAGCFRPARAKKYFAGRRVDRVRTPGPYEPPRDPGRSGRTGAGLLPAESGQALHGRAQLRVARV